LLNYPIPKPWLSLWFYRLFVGKKTIKEVTSTGREKLAETPRINPEKKKHT